MRAGLRIVLRTKHRIDPRDELIQLIQQRGKLRQRVAVVEDEIHCAYVSFSVTGIMKASIDGGMEVANEAS
jgi:hypothetical protein